MDYLRVGMIGCRTYGVYGKEKNVDQFCEIALEHNPFDLLLGPTEFANKSYDNPLYTVQERQGIEEKLKQCSKELGSPLLGFGLLWESENGEYRITAPLFSQGKLHYHSTQEWMAADAQDTISRLGLKFPTEHNRGAFQWQSYTVGIELCVDHHSDRNVVNALRNRNIQDLDLQLVLSNGMSLKQNSLVLKDGGAVLLCDGRNLQEVYVREGQRYKEILPFERRKINEEISLILYEIPIRREL